MTLRAFIVDDEPPARARLRQMLDEAGDVLVVGEAGDAFEARSAIAEARPDVVFLDIEMPQMSGTAFAATLAEPRPFVVFATAFDHYALDAFAVDATDYLVKPITRARLSGTLARVRERLSRTSDLERDLAAASAAQALLMPRVLPRIAGVDAAAATIPARGVGGDFYLSQQIDEGRFVLALGDVSGKGMPAGLVASSLQARLEAVARHAGGTASDVVADVNRALCSTSDSARFATLVYLELSTWTRDVAIVNAGHLPVLVASPQGTLQRISSTGPALGMIPNASFPAAHLPRTPGSTFVAYSDGVSEALDVNGNELGDERVAALVGAHGARPATELCQAIIDAVNQHAHGVRQADDVSVMVVKCE